ncbi:MAG: hypothetical protein EP347_05340 [Alphaproteobacteria bacterium]|nr:MAG: hypothetical protein EP347_05340 [Alphaproteobacteria bacterium]
MSTRTTRVFRDEGLFEYLAEGPILLDRLEGEGPARHISTAFALVITGLLAAITLMGYESEQEQFTYIFAGMTALAGLHFLRRLYFSIAGRVGRKAGRRGPLPVVISNDGVEQRVGDETSSKLDWGDIRLVRRQDDVESIRGKDKKISVELSHRLAHTREATAIVKFLFVLRQEMGEDWQGAVPSLQKRLADKGIPIYSRKSRKWYVVISQKGLASVTAKGGRAELTWDQVDRSLYEVKRNKVVVRHVQSRTTVEIPSDIESPILFDQLMRWALHSNPVFNI